MTADELLVEPYPAAGLGEPMGDARAGNAGADDDCIRVGCHLIAPQPDLDPSLTPPNQICAKT